MREKERVRQGEGAGETDRREEDRGEWEERSVGERRGVEGQVGTRADK